MSTRIAAYDLKRLGIEVAEIEYRQRFGNRNWHLPVVRDAAPYDGMLAPKNLSAEKNIETAGSIVWFFRIGDAYYSLVSINV